MRHTSFGPSEATARQKAEPRARVEASPRSAYSAKEKIVSFLLTLAELTLAERAARRGIAEGF